MPVGRLLADAPPAGRPRPAGSCIVVVATDAPLHAAQLERVARRAGLGLARTGSVAHHGSGEIFLAFSTARGAGTVADGELDPLFAATVDATEEAVLNALWAPSGSSAARAASPRRCRTRRSSPCCEPTGASDVPGARCGICTKSAQKPAHDVHRSCSIAPDHAGAGPAGSDTGGALACGQGARRLGPRSR